jgi:quinolinate synthase
VATEHGIVHQMKQRWPGKEFIIADGCIGCRMHCPYMKMVDLMMIRDALQRGKHEITVPADVAEGARRALERMIAVPRDA